MPIGAGNGADPASPSNDPESSREWASRRGGRSGEPNQGEDPPKKPPIPGEVSAPDIPTERTEARAPRGA